MQPDTQPEGTIHEMRQTGFASPSPDDAGRKLDRALLLFVADERQILIGDMALKYQVAWRIALQEGELLVQ